MQNLNGYVNPSKFATHFGVLKNVSRVSITSCGARPDWHVSRFLELSALTGKA